MQEHEIPTASAATNPERATSGAPPQELPALMRKNPALAAVLSAFPGMGNIYNGLYLRGLTFFAAIFAAMLLAGEEEVFAFAVIFFWIFNIIDAYRQATLINYGYLSDLGISDPPRSPRAMQGGLWAGIVFIVIGLLAVLDRFFGIDIDRLLELWPFGLVLLGAWLVWTSVRDRRRGGDEGEEEALS